MAMKTISAKVSSLEHYIKLKSKYQKDFLYQHAFSKDSFFVPFDATLSYYRYFDINSEKEVGHIAIYQPNDKNILWIQSILVFRDCLRNKYGTKIVEDIMNQYCRHHNISSIYLTCYKNNNNGICFWKQLGFSIVSLKENSFINSTSLEKAYIFKKDLL